MREVGDPEDIARPKPLRHEQIATAGVGRDAGGGRDVRGDRPDNRARGRIELHHGTRALEGGIEAPILAERQAIGFAGDRRRRHLRGR